MATDVFLRLASMPSESSSGMAPTRPDFSPPCQITTSPSRPRRRPSARPRDKMSRGPKFTRRLETAGKSVQAGFSAYRRLPASGGSTAPVNRSARSLAGCFALVGSATEDRLRRSAVADPTRLRTDSDGLGISRPLRYDRESPVGTRKGLPCVADRFSPPRPPWPDRPRLIQRSRLDGGKPVRGKPLRATYYGPEYL